MSAFEARQLSFERDRRAAQVLAYVADTKRALESARANMEAAAVCKEQIEDSVASLGRDAAAATEAARRCDAWDTRAAVGDAGATVCEAVPQREAGLRKLLLHSAGPDAPDEARAEALGRVIDSLQPSAFRRTWPPAGHPDAELLLPTEHCDTTAALCGCLEQAAASVTARGDEAGRAAESDLAAHNAAAAAAASQLDALTQALGRLQEARKAALEGETGLAPLLAAVAEAEAEAEAAEEARRAAEASLEAPARAVGEASIEALAQASRALAALPGHASAPTTVDAGGPGSPPSEAALRAVAAACRAVMGHGRELAEVRAPAARDAVLASHARLGEAVTRAQARHAAVAAAAEDTAARLDALSPTGAAGEWAAAVTLARGAATSPDGPCVAAAVDALAAGLDPDAAEREADEAEADMRAALGEEAAAAAACAAAVARRDDARTSLEAATAAAASASASRAAAVADAADASLRQASAALASSRFGTPACIPPSRSAVRGLAAFAMAASAASLAGDVSLTTTPSVPSSPVGGAAGAAPPLPGPVPDATPLRLLARTEPQAQELAAAARAFAASVEALQTGELGAPQPSSAADMLLQLVGALLRHEGAAGDDGSGGPGLRDAEIGGAFAAVEGLPAATAGVREAHEAAAASVKAMASAFGEACDRDGARLERACAAGGRR